MRLIEIWFKYGHYHESPDSPGFENDKTLQKEIEASIQIIDVECWLNVVPQVIAKMDIRNEIIEKSIQD